MSDRLYDKRALRILLLLRKSECEIQETSKRENVLLDAGDYGVITEEISFLLELSQEKLVSVSKNGFVRLSKAGDELLARRDEMKVSASAGETYDACTIEELSTSAGSENVIINNAESPLALLARRKNKAGVRFLTVAEFQAGERLRNDYTRGHLMPSLGVNWQSVGGGSGRSSGDANGIASLTDAALASRQRVEKAVSAVGPELSGVLIDVCCFLKGLEQVEAERAWPARSAKIILKSALSALARYYEPKRYQTATKPPILHWGSADYRPRAV